MVKKQGFTLLELMITISVMVVLSAVISTKAGQQIAKARDSRAISIISSWRSAMTIAYADKFYYSLSFDDLKLRVDSKTLSLTYSSNEKDEFIGSLSTQWTQAGESAYNKDMVSFTIEGNYSEAYILFDSENGNDTKGNPWYNY